MTLADLASDVRALALPVAVGLDLDGTLAPIVDHPDAATLTPGAIEALDALLGAGVAVSVVSGRKLADLTRFGLPVGVAVVGSHGLEDGTAVTLSDEDRTRLAVARHLAERAAESAPGAWVEDKPAGIALHVRQADADAARTAVVMLAEAVADQEGLYARAGHEVLEVAVLPSSKAEAVERLRTRSGAASVVFVGDDVTDEEVLAALGPNDLGVRVGPGVTAARHRVSTPEEVVQLLFMVADHAHAIADHH
jgi:trehalose 6-phosphate phosphatase